jgi:hypothetical protein
MKIGDMFFPVVERASNARFAVIHPEKVRVSSDGEGSESEMRCLGTIRHVARQELTTELTIDIGGTTLKSAILTDDLTKMKAGQGSTVSVTVDPVHVHLL